MSHQKHTTHYVYTMCIGCLLFMDMVVQLLSEDCGKKEEKLREIHEIILQSYDTIYLLHNIHIPNYIYQEKKSGGENEVVRYTPSL